jgi:hypothetical protein
VKNLFFVPPMGSPAGLNGDPEILLSFPVEETLNP